MMRTGLDYSPELLETLRAIGAAGRWQEVLLRLRPVRNQIATEPWALVLLAEAHAHVNVPSDALQAARRALLLFRQAGDSMGEMKAMNEAAIAHFQLGSLASAEEQFRDLLALAETLGDQTMEAKAANNLGALCSLREQREDALVFYQRALESYARRDDVKGQAQTFHNVGITYRDMGQLREAEAHFLKAAQWARQAGDEQLFAFALTARAELALEDENLLVAEGASRQALMRFDTSASACGVAEAYKLAGLIAAKRGQDDIAIVHLDKALKQAQEVNASLIVAEILLERGALRLRHDDASGAKDDLERASALFTLLEAEALAQRARGLLWNPPAPSPNPAIFA